MNVNKEIEQILDSIRKVAFYVGHGKYNDYMTTEEVQKIKKTLEQILEIEKEYEEANTDKDKKLIYKRLEIYKTFTIKDFIEYNAE
jgi:succinate dehydrogenase/fumarate reductase flavoprotein subunit